MRRGCVVGSSGSDKSAWKSVGVSASEPVGDASSTPAADRAVRDAAADRAGDAAVDPARDALGGPAGTPVDTAPRVGSVSRRRDGRPRSSAILASTARFEKSTEYIPGRSPQTCLSDTKEDIDGKYHSMSE